MDNLISKGVYLKRVYNIKEDKLLVFVYSDGTAYAQSCDPLFDYITI